jgi:hypothetical protein
LTRWRRRGRAEGSFTARRRRTISGACRVACEAADKNTGVCG